MCSVHVSGDRLQQVWAVDSFYRNGHKVFYTPLIPKYGSLYKYPCMSFPLHLSAFGLPALFYH